MLAFALATFLVAPVLAAPPGPVVPLPAELKGLCKLTKEFKGEAPSEIIEKKYAERYEFALKAVDCRDDGFCYQLWGKNCKH
ncbi:MAG: hypothetical protein EBU30_08670 [Synechococcaceae bacterium WB6_3B_236]|jgi:hypothetical protein|nr:hypothetical protein [Synechococcaceae bacterium WB6_3B_236]